MVNNKEKYKFRYKKKDLVKIWKIINMKIYINKKKCTGCGKCKAACPEGPRVYSIEEKDRKSLHFEGFLLLSWLQNVCDCLYGRCNHP